MVQVPERDASRLPVPRRSAGEAAVAALVSFVLVGFATYYVASLIAGLVITVASVGLGGAAAWLAWSRLRGEPPR